MNMATPNPSSQIGEVRLSNNDGVGGAATMTNFINNKLEAKDVYKDMKNKTIYGNSSAITAHASLNTL